ncbi:hypothetical protein QYN14_26635 (plasmid) [Rhodococcus ruber]|uniref:hypothetical protein n=1 Tax=Rhodococcus ruber TaxID=1830 RepID=UPI002657D668|nr:hypothetical protein [Rhodococcus ruber]WKK14877.1 hypothetical protein QYN14_26635 [Rhodococcus ruber]
MSEVSRHHHDVEGTWTSYRQQAVHGLTFCLYTIGRSVLQPSVQPDSVSRINIERLATAIEDLDTFELIERAP